MLHSDARSPSPPLAVIGLFPPPVHGQSVLTEKMAAFLETQVPVIRLSLGRQSVFSKIGMHLQAALRLLTLGGRRTVYSTPPGQKGLWLFLLIVAAARLSRRRLFIHHHSFRVISAGPLLAMRLGNALGGPNIHHIFLGERMRDGFCSLYKPPPQGFRASVVPNAFAYPPPATAPVPRTGRLTVGHISNLTMEKGVGRVIDLFERLRREGRDIRLVLAGPVSDPKLTPLIAASQSRHKDAFDYRGPVYGEAKTRFFADIDLLLLPSSLVDEADPLVIQEAYEAGVDVMASNRGCIAERLRRQDAFLTLDPVQDAAQIGHLLDELALHRDVVATASWHHAGTLHRRAHRQAEALITQLLDDASA